MLELFNHWAPLIWLTWNVGVTIVVYLMSRSFVSHTDLAVLDKRVGRLEDRDEAAPDWDVINRINDRLASLEGNYKGISPRLDSMTADHQYLRNRVDQIADFLLKKEST
ncbi:MAG TPA: hypothetical protein VFB15_11695 [Candidatus Binataceae bacterium]|nr:hypothetical protein [Candidatus Binataceae bacterium]